MVEYFKEIRFLKKRGQAYLILYIVPISILLALVEAAQRDFRLIHINCQQVNMDLYFCKDTF